MLGVCVDMDLSCLSAILVGAGCLALGYLVGTSYPATIFVWTRKAKDTALINNNKKKKNDNPKEPFEIEKLADILDDFKMVFTFPFSFFS